MEAHPVGGSPVEVLSLVVSKGRGHVHMGDAAKRAYGGVVYINDPVLNDVKCITIGYRVLNWTNISSMIESEHWH